MEFQVQNDIKNKLLILLDSNNCERIKENETEDINRLINESLLTDSLLIETLNAIHGIAGMTLYSKKVSNSSFKELIDNIKSNNIDPKDGMDFDKPNSMDEFYSLYSQLIRDMRVLEIGNEVILEEKRNNQIIEEIKNSLSYINVDELDEKKVLAIKEIANNLSNQDKYEKVIEDYNKLAQSIWHDFLNDPNNMIVHIGVVDGEYQGNVLSASLITEKEAATFTPHGEGVGIIVKPKTILAADSKDLAIGNYRDYQENIFKERPVIKLPRQIEEELIDKTIEANGENLLYDGLNNPVYSEVVLKDYEVVGYIMLGYGDKSKTSEYNDLKEKATSENLEFKYIDINEMRSKQNLQPVMPSKNK